MIKTIFIFLLIPFSSCSQKQAALQQNFSFPVTDGEVTTLNQSNDTLYELKCYIDKPCQPRPEKHYKILSSNTSGAFTIFKLEQLDTIRITSDPYPLTRYSVLALKNADNKQLGYLILNFRLTKEQLDTVNTGASLLKDKFFFTFFSKDYLKELALLKKVTTKEDVALIIATMRSDKFKKLMEDYSNTKTNDYYASGLSAEFLNRACIENGFNPIGAGPEINRLMKQ